MWRHGVDGDDRGASYDFGAPLVNACTACGVEFASEARFCSRCGAPAPTGGTLGFVPAEVQSRVAAGGPSEERRLLTALFADVSGFTALAERLDVEDLMDVIDPLLARLGAIVAAHEGFVNKYAGDALLAVFGAPIAHEDDPERALRASLEMHGAVDALRARLPEEARGLALRVGVSSGHGVVRVRETEARMDYDVLGSSIIVAQRLESVAVPGTVYVAESTHRLTEATFAFEPLGAFTLKGLDEPVRAWRLLGERRDAEPFDLPRIVGREAELAFLDDTVATLLEGRGSTLVIESEPGVGKTRLLQEARARAETRGVRWIQARCHSHRIATAYAPLARMVWAAAGIAGSHPVQVDSERVAGLAARLGLDEDAGLIGRLAGTHAADPRTHELAPEALRRDLHSAFVRLAAALASERPTIIAIEDVHWADSASLDLITEIAASGGPVPLALILTRRPETPARRALERATRLRLQPLGPGWIDELLTVILGDHPPAALAEVVGARWGGNPFFATEIVRCLQDEGQLTRNGSWRLRNAGMSGVPERVETLLASRIDRLAVDAAGALGACAVVGRRGRIDLLRAIVADVPDLDTVLEVLVEHGFIRRAKPADGPEIFAFSHALVQEVAYARLLRRDRRRLHLAVADAARQSGAPDGDLLPLLAHHLYLAEAGLSAIDALVRAAEHSASLFANPEAILQLERAVSLAREDGEAADLLPDLLIGLADLCDLTGAYERALALFSEARDLGGGARAWAGMAAAVCRLGQLEGALELLDQAGRASAWTADDRALLALERGHTLSVAGRFTGVAKPLRDCLAARRGVRDALTARLLLQLARVVSEIDPEEAADHARESRAIFDDLKDLGAATSALRALGDALRRLARLDEASAALEEGLALAERTGRIEEVCGCLVNLGLLEVRRGRYRSAITRYERVMAECERIGHAPGRAVACSNLAEALLLAGDHDAALARAEETISAERVIGDGATLADALLTAGIVRSRRGEFARAARALQESAELFEVGGMSDRACYSGALAADAWKSAGAPERARMARRAGGDASRDRGDEPPAT